VVAILLSLLSAAAYGTSDFVGGIAASRLPPWTVSMLSNLVGGLACVAVALASAGAVTGPDLAWAGLAAVGNVVGTTFLYRGMNAGRMGVVAPVSGVCAALVPAIVGVAGGERPGLAALVGVVLALPGIWLVSTGSPPEDSEVRSGVGAGVADGLVAGTGFGVLFVALAQASEGSGLWPVAVNQLIAAALVVGLASALRVTWRPRRDGSVTAGVAGLLGTAATAAFLVATRHGYLTVTSVISALYPAATVLLAAVVLRERIGRGQAAGLVLCATAVAFVAAA